MKNASKIIGLYVALLAAGCSSAGPKQKQSRGWMGGQYKVAKGALLPAGYRSGVYVQAVYEGTPAASAGLKPGDLVLELGENRLRDTKDFYSITEKMKPGEKTIAKVWRGGVVENIAMVSGQEIYEQWHAVRFGVFASAKFDLWPDDSFAAPPLVQYEIAGEHLELRSPEALLTKLAAESRSKKQEGLTSKEGWSCWLGLLGFSAHKTILAQEQVAAQTASTR
jgi:hypothetical protein